MRLITWIAKLGYGVRALLCIDDTRKDSTDVDPTWAEVMSNALIVDDTTEWRECIESLRFDGMHQRRDQVADPLPATNQWLWETEEFQEWKSSGKILWIMGKAGSGKSVLAKNIQQRLQKDVPNGDLNDDPFVCDWFYSARGPDFGAKDASMLRALTFNILSSSKTTFEPATAIYRARFDAGRQDDAWLLSELSDLLTTLALSPSTPRTLAVIDALDESESVTGPSSLKSTNNSFDLLQMVTEIASPRKSRLRFVLLSRPESVISKNLNNCLKIKMEQYNNRDISIMIEGGIKKLRVAWQNAVSPNSEDHDPTDFYEDSNVLTDTQSQKSQSSNDNLKIQEETLGEIRAYLEINANGVMLWVILIVQQLLLLIENERGFTVQKLLASLTASPSEVEEIYIKFLEDLKVSSTPQELSETKRILEWIVGSQRVSSLRLRELREVIALPDQLEVEKHGEFSHQLIASRRIVLGENGWPNFCRIMQTYCGPLIEILDDRQRVGLDSRQKIRRAESDWTIQLSHQTVHAFLRTPGRSGEFYINAASAEEMVTNQSYRYLGIRTSTPRQASYRSAAEGERDPILVLEVALAPLLRDVSLLATREYARSKKRPLVEFALDVILKSYSDNTTIFRTLGKADTDGLTSRDWIAIHWLADLCFTPAFPGTNLEPFILNCCKSPT
ncbi:uncharacterized protein BDZ83DRAFT_756849 [Colletotrichum acutatum]|uniref:Nephrocystin 3-like N-terminal domain-containing protein n=1 Tax=Glomerella acutata TaxID=27357 RepID=A0AAD8UD26_GLOAC|nr:uncharacterized protein BDZ83DRAFT_756849 [Colletotrichum acutatum]KAK1712979.1 hypothetical protein BDZ83DRAFT_756849 [Colletotrichum acutatum]